MDPNEVQETTYDDGGPIPVPPNLTKTWSPEDWSGLAPAQQRKIAETAKRQKGSHDEHIARLAEKMGEYKARLEGLESANNKPDRSDPSKAATWSDLDDVTWQREAENALKLWERKLREPDNEEVQKATEGLSAAVVASVFKEYARREGQAAVQSLRSETQKMTEAQRHAAQLSAKLIPLVGQSALIDQSHPLHQRKDEIYSDLVEANGGEATAALEYAAWRAAASEANASRGGRGNAPGHLEIEGFATSRPDAEDPEVSALRRQGKRMEASRLRLRKFLENGISRPGR